MFDIEIEFMPLVIRKLPHHFCLGVPSYRRREASWRRQSVVLRVTKVSNFVGCSLSHLSHYLSAILAWVGVKSISGHLFSHHKLDIVSHRREFIFLELIPTHLSAR